MSKTHIWLAGSRSLLQLPHSRGLGSAGALQDASACLTAKSFGSFYWKSLEIWGSSECMSELGRI